MTIADATSDAKVRAARDGNAPPRGIAQWMRRIHDGHDMPFVWQIIVFLGGLLPAILAFTGIIMWWRARNWRGDLKRRQQARAGKEAPAAAE